MDGRAQLKRLQLARHRDRWTTLVTIVGVFFAGAIAGSLVFTYAHQPPMQMASSGGKTALAFFLNGMSAPPR